MAARLKRHRRKIANSKVGKIGGKNRVKIFLVEAVAEMMVLVEAATAPKNRADEIGSGDVNGRVMGIDKREAEYIIAMGCYTDNSPIFAAGGDEDVIGGLNN